MQWEGMVTFKLSLFFSFDSNIVSFFTHTMVYLLFFIEITIGVFYLLLFMGIPIGELGSTDDIKTQNHMD